MCDDWDCGSMVNSRWLQRERLYRYIYLYICGYGERQRRCWRRDGRRQGNLSLGGRRQGSLCLGGRHQKSLWLGGRRRKSLNLRRPASEALEAWKSEQKLVFEWPAEERKLVLVLNYFYQMMVKSSLVLWWPVAELNLVFRKLNLVVCDVMEVMEFGRAEPCWLEVGEAEPSEKAN